MAVPEFAAVQSVEEMHRLLVCGDSSTPAGGSPVRWHAKAFVPACAGLQPAGRMAGVLLSVRGREQERTAAGWRTRSVAVSIVEETLQRGVIGRRLAQRPHASQRCVENVEIDVEDYPPGGDPQNGQ